MDAPSHSSAARRIAARFTNGAMSTSHFRLTPYERTGAGLTEADEVRLTFSLVGSGTSGQVCLSSPQWLVLLEER